MSNIDKLFQRAFEIGQSNTDHDEFAVALFRAAKAAIPSLPNRLGYNVDANDIYLWRHYGQPYCHTLHDRIKAGKVITWRALRQFVYFKLMSESVKLTKREEARQAMIERYAEHLSRSAAYHV